MPPFLSDYYIDRLTSFECISLPECDMWCHKDALQESLAHPNILPNTVYHLYILTSNHLVVFSQSNTSIEISLL